MDNYFKSFQITLLDILAILFPGTVNFILVLIAYLIFDGKDFNATPLEAWHVILNRTNGSNIFFTIISYTVIAYIIGFILKIWAPLISEKIVNYVYRFFCKECRKIHIDDFAFPFDYLFKEKGYYSYLVKHIQTVIGCDPKELYGSGVLRTSQMLIKQKSRVLWDDIERRSVEVRLTSSLFVAAVFSTILSVISFVLYECNFMLFCFWFLCSAFLIIILGVGFRKIRKREVGYTYISTLIVLGTTKDIAQE